MVTTMRLMLFEAEAFDQSLDSFDISSVTDLTNMLSGSGMSYYNYDATLIGWSQQPVIPTNISLGTHGLTYCNGAVARAVLTDMPHNWNIIGDTLKCLPFITTWRTSFAGESITLLTSSFYNYNFSIDWENDGIIDTTGVTGDITHAYAVPDDYEVAIYGDFPFFRSTSSNPNEKLISIDQWGTISWRALSFANSPLLTYTATDKPDLSKVTYLDMLFENCSLFNGDIGSWDVSNVTSMWRMFQNATQFNQAIGSWDVSNVTIMSLMFQGASHFNQDISGWDVGQVTLMNGLFENAHAFNHPLNDWKTDNVLNMNSMFRNATSFDQPLNQWDTGKATSMYYMFQGALAFNKPISNWNTSQVTDMNGMFDEAILFNQDLTNWETGNVTNMRVMFRNAKAFDGSINDWNTSSVTDMINMFNGALSFNQPINKWDTGNVTDMNGMFANTEIFNMPMDSLDVSNVESMYSMFEDAKAFNQDLTSWEVGQVTDMFAMFKNTEAFNKPLNTWDVSNVEYMDEMFSNALVFNQPLDQWELDNVESLESMFESCSSFNQNLGGWNIENVENMDNMLDASGLSLTNYDSTMIGWAAQDVLSGVALGAEGLTYCTGASARQSLIDQSWDIEGDMMDCNGPCTTLLTNTFMGPSIGIWNNTNNWSENRIPNECDEVVIESNKSVSLIGDAKCATLQIAVGAIFEINGFNLSVEIPK